MDGNLDKDLNENLAGLTQKIIGEGRGWVRAPTMCTQNLCQKVT